MATNPKAVELAKQRKVEYEWGTRGPNSHKEKMNWGGGFKTKGDVDILFLSGETGRDPFEDAPCRTPEEERAGKGKVVSHDVKQQTRQCLEYIKNKLEMMDASLKNIVMFRYYLPRREDVFDMRDEMYPFSRSSSRISRHIPGHPLCSRASESILSQFPYTSRPVPLLPLR